MSSVNCVTSNALIGLDFFPRCCKRKSKHRSASAPARIAFLFPWIEVSEASMRERGSLCKKSFQQRGEGMQAAFRELILTKSLRRLYLYFHLPAYPPCNSPLTLTISHFHVGGLTQPNAEKDKRLKQDRREERGEKKNILVQRRAASAFFIFIPACHRPSALVIL